GSGAGRRRRAASPTRRSSDLGVSDPAKTGAENGRPEPSAYFSFHPAFIAHCDVYLCTFTADRIWRFTVVESWLGLSAFTLDQPVDRKSTRLNSSHVKIS